MKISILNSEKIHEHYHELKSYIDYFSGSKKRTELVINNLKHYIENDSAIVAGHIIDSKLSSFIWCYQRDYAGKKRLHISYIIVEKSFRGQGLSKDLLRFVKNYAMQKGIAEIDLNVDPDNTNALKIYENEGFSVEKLQLVQKINKGDINV